MVVERVVLVTSEMILGMIVTVLLSYNTFTISQKCFASVIIYQDMEEQCIVN